MGQYVFIPPSEIVEGGRSSFANRICKLIYEKHDGNIDAAILEAEPFFNDLEEHVRNIYELICNEIPLWAYWYLLKHGADNFGFTESEYQTAIHNSIHACIDYYKG